MYNFQEILEKNSIEVPLIQRDYAQGREDEKVSEIRDIFLEAISEKLLSNEKLHLDFVYGSTKENKFIPLDGQQRLTTLFLLHWYFGKKENQEIGFLSKFTYATRASSREFCQKIVKNEIDFSSDDLVESIENSKWFLAFWKNDPTIKSMLVMISSIHLKFKDNYFFDKLSNITFECFELEKFGLDDDLYIKMNARGKPLTEFEIFKAKFEQLLSQKDKKLELEFSQKINNEWTDFFWKYKDEKFLVDNAFMNYFQYISEMLFYKDNEESKRLLDFSFKKIESIYSDIENIKFLFKALDSLASIVIAFNTIFSKGEYVEGKIALFEKDINYVEQVIKEGSVSIQKKFILFVMISYLNDNEMNDDFKDFIRVVRNFVERTRSTQRRNLQYTPNFEYKEINKILHVFLKYMDKNIYNELLNSSNDWQFKEFGHEIDKAKLISKDADFKEILFQLEDYRYLKGDIHNFIDDDINEVKYFSESIKDIFDNSDDSLIIRGMLSSGDCRFNKGGTSRVKNRYFFGKTDLWEIFLTDASPVKPSFFKTFIKEYTLYNKDIDEIIENFLSAYASKEKDWKYYFVKYKAIFDDNDENLSKDRNFFAWHNDYNIEKMGGLHLGAFHINPYVRVVSLNTNENYGVHIKGEENSYLAIENYIDRMESIDKNWTIKFSDGINEKIKDDLIQKFSLKKDEYSYILNININININDNDNDRIEKAIEFIKHLESWM